MIFNCLFEFISFPCKCCHPYLLGIYFYLFSCFVIHLFSYQDDIYNNFFFYSFTLGLFKCKGTVSLKPSDVTIKNMFLFIEKCTWYPDNCKIIQVRFCPTGGGENNPMPHGSHYPVLSCLVHAPSYLSLINIWNIVLLN